MVSRANSQMSESNSNCSSARPMADNNNSSRIQADRRLPELSHPVGCLLRREIQPYHNRARYCGFVPLARHTLYFLSPRKTFPASLHSLQVQNATEWKLLKGPHSLSPCSQNKVYEAPVGVFLDPGAIITVDRQQGSVTRVVARSRPTKENRRRH